jgi:hypothetical protein
VNLSRHMEREQLLIVNGVARIPSYKERAVYGERGSTSLQIQFM